VSLDRSLESKFGIVVIGRNEGARLRNCLASVAAHAERVVYVDSDSTDGSVDMARSMGVAVVELDMSIPFTAARARNQGFVRLCELSPEITYVQFVDGDCEVREGWLDYAVSFLDQHMDVAVVCGRQREQYPWASVYNLMCDIEWNTPVGQAKACGGCAMMRVDVFSSVGGYRPSLIAGEEPELCVRLRASGWKIFRLDVEMTWHDAHMLKFHQWWNRARRSGYAFAEGAYLHGVPPERHWVRESRSIMFWGGGIPALTLLSIILFGVSGAALVLIYPAQVIRLALRDRKTSPAPWWRALFLVLGKFAEIIGLARFVYFRLVGKNSRLIEYK